MAKLTSTLISKSQENTKDSNKNFKSSTLMWLLIFSKWLTKTVKQKFLKYFIRKNFLRGKYYFAQKGDKLNFFIDFFTIFLVSSIKRSKYSTKLLTNFNSRSKIFSKTSDSNQKEVYRIWDRRSANLKVSTSMKIAKTDTFSKVPVWKEGSSWHRGGRGLF